jgi:hypothetical protein
LNTIEPINLLLSSRERRGEEEEEEEEKKKEKEGCGYLLSFQYEFSPFV